MKVKLYNKLIIPAVILVFVLRFAEISFLADRGTSHYIAGDGFHYIFWAVYFLIAAFFASSFFTLSKTNFGFGYLKKTTSHIYLFMVPALLLFCDTAISVINYIAVRPSVFEIFLTVFEFLAAVAFVLLSVFPTKVRFRSAATKLFTIAIPVYFVLRLFYINIVRYGFISKPYDTFEIFKTAFLALAFSEIAYMAVAKATRKKLSAYIYLSAIFMSIRLSDVLYSVLNNAAADTSVSYISQAADLFCIAALFLINMNIYKRIRKPKEVEGTADE